VISVFARHSSSIAVAACAIKMTTCVISSLVRPGGANMNARALLLRLPYILTFDNGRKIDLWRLNASARSIEHVKVFEGVHEYARYRREEKDVILDADTGLVVIPEWTRSRPGLHVHSLQDESRRAFVRVNLDGMLNNHPLIYREGVAVSQLSHRSHLPSTAIVFWNVAGDQDVLTTLSIPARLNEHPDAGDLYFRHVCFTPNGDLIGYYAHDDTLLSFTLALWRKPLLGVGQGQEPDALLELGEQEETMEREECTMEPVWAVPLDAEAVLVCAQTWDLDVPGTDILRTSTLFAVESTDTLRLRWRSEPVRCFAREAHLVPTMETIIVVGERFESPSVALGSTTIVFALNSKNGEILQEELLPNHNFGRSVMACAMGEGVDSKPVLLVVFDDGEVQRLPVDLFVEQGFCLTEGQVGLAGTERAAFELPEGWKVRVACASQKMVVAIISDKPSGGSSEVRYMTW
jgi:hypothetical protein